MTGVKSTLEVREDVRALRLHLALGALVAGGIALGIVISPAETLESLRSALSSPWFPFLLVGLYLLRPLLAWPITALSVLVGYRYGLAMGVPIALAGAVATSLFPYAAARYFRTDVGLVGRATAGSERFFSTAGDFRGVVAARLAPTPAEVISVAAGVARVSVPAFVAGTAVGELPWTIAAVLAGHSMNRLAIAGVETVDPLLIVGGLVGAGVLLAGPIVRLVRENFDAI